MLQPSPLSQPGIYLYPPLHRTRIEVSSSTYCPTTFASTTVSRLSTLPPSIPTSTPGVPGMTAGGYKGTSQNGYKHNTPKRKLLRNTFFSVDGTKYGQILHCCLYACCMCSDGLVVSLFFFWVLGITREWYVWEWSSCVGEGVLDAGVAARSSPFTIALASTGSFAIIAVDNTVNDFTTLIKYTHLRSCDRNSPSPCLQGCFQGCIPCKYNVVQCCSG